MLTKKWSLVGCAILLSGLAACSSPSPSPSEAALAPSDVEFTGPWAAEFSASYERASDDFSRNAIVDGEISEQEYSEMIDRFESCVSDLGYEIDEYKLDGSFNLSFPPDTDADIANEDVKSCSRNSGEAEIGSLYSWTHRNPDRMDEDTLIVNCLVETGVVPSSYSISDYTSDTTRDDFPFVDEDKGRDALEECRVDPLGLQS